MSRFVSPAPTGTLRNFSQRLVYVDFDVKNPEHIKAYISLTQYGRQHPTLRFNVIDGYQDVHSMMNAIVGAEFIKQFPELDEAVRDTIATTKVTKVA